MAIKIQGFDTAAGGGGAGAIRYAGTYNATTNTPDLTSSLLGDQYYIEVGGTLAGVTLDAGDFILFNQDASSPITSAMFNKVDSTDAVDSVNGEVGIVVLDTDDISETATNQYFTAARFTSELATKTTDDVSEGATNLYYTNNRFDTQLATKDSDDITEGATNQYFTSPRFTSELATKTTDDVSEGATNLYYTNSRFDTQLATKDSDDIAEGATNQYFTSPRFTSELATKTTDDVSEGATNLYYTNSRFDTQLATKDSDDITEGATNQYFTSPRFTSELATKTTDDVSEGATNLYYTNNRFDTQLATKDSDDITEGATNLYFTNTRADARISAADLTDLNDVDYTAGAAIDGRVLTYVNANSRWEAVAPSGGAVGTFQQVTDQGSTTTTNISTAQITLSGDLLADAVLTRTLGDETNRFITSYSDLNGAIRFKAKASEALSKGDVVYIDGVSGGVPTVSKARSNSASTMPGFGLCYAAASLNAEVQIVTLGNIEGLNTGSFSVGDTLYVSDTTAGALTNIAPTGENNLIQNIAKVVKVDAVGNSGIYKVGGAGRTAATPNLNQDKIFLGNASNQAVSTALSSINLSSLNNNLDTDDIAEGASNLYFTSPRFTSELATKTTDDVSEGVINLYYTNSRFDTQLATKDTDDIAEGATNQYFTSPRFTSELATKTTDDVSEGAINLYYTNSRFDTQLATKDTDDIAEGATNQYFTNTRADARISAADLTDLNDVDYTAGAAIDGRVLTYVNANSRWEAVAASGGGGGFTYSAITSASSPVSGAIEYHYSADTSGGAITIDLPAIAAGNAGKEIRVKLKTAGNNLVLSPDGTNQVEAGGAGVDYTLTVQNTAITLVSDGSTNWEII